MSLLLRIIILSLLINYSPPASSAQAPLTRISWPENVFHITQEFEWQYLDVAFYGAIDVICPCQNDSTTFIIDNDLSEINLVSDDINSISSSITHLIKSEGLWFIVENSTFLLDLEGIPFIYPVIREFGNGTRINWLEYLANNNPRTNYTELLYVTRRIEDGYYIQRKVFATNPWFRFETKIDLKTGIMVSLWFEEGFVGFSSRGFSHIYNLTLITDLPKVPKGSKTVDSRIIIGSTIIGFILVIIIIRYKFRKNPF